MASSARPGHTDDSIVRIPRPRGIDQLCERALPACWQDDIVAALGRQSIAGAPRVAVRRAVVDLESVLRARMGSVEAPRRRVRSAAERARRGGEDARAAAERAAAIEIERAFARVGALAGRFANTALREAALASEAAALHRRARTAYWDPHSRDTIVDAEACALATALLLFWTTYPFDYFCSYRSPRAAPRELRDECRFVSTLAARIARGEFLHLGVAFDPRSFDGRDLTTDASPAVPRTRPIPRPLWVRTTKDGIEALTSTAGGRGAG